ncbi:hypothetical protein BJX99DRAFT_225731 [Aspergillus californicus]
MRSSQTTMSSNTPFHLFPKLPCEIRFMIWRECLPNRIMELDSQVDELLWDDDIPCSANRKIAKANVAPPLITRVCRESRAVALEKGSRQPLPDPKNKDIQDFSKYMLEYPWFDETRDAVHTNWHPWGDIEWETYDWGDPIRCVMWYAARSRSRQASILMSVLQAFHSIGDHPRNPDHFRWTRSGLAELMRTWPSWTVVIVPPVVIHADPETAAGLFGLLADARVQLVGANDQPAIDRFMALGKRPGVMIAPGFQEQLESAKGELRDAVKGVFGGTAAPIIRPVIMFRLCTSLHIDT